MEENKDKNSIWDQMVILWKGNLLLRLGMIATVVVLLLVIACTVIALVTGDWRWERIALFPFVAIAAFWSWIQNKAVKTEKEYQKAVKSAGNAPTIEQSPSVQKAQEAAAQNDTQAQEDLVEQTSEQNKADEIKDNADVGHPIEAQIDSFTED